MESNQAPLWKLISSNILTRWAKNVSPDEPFPEYPRPQFKRKEWMSLNGLWDYAIRPKNVKSVRSFDGKILVPFPIESALSGIKRKLGHKQRLWYRRKFSIPKSWKDKNLLLHFGAVDWEATVWINGKRVGSHKGGYVPFTFEISEHLNKNENEISVAVWDPTNKGGQERGKQSLRPWGIYYTAISGIWQTVWLEPVPISRIESLKMIPDIDKEILNINVKIHGLESGDKIQLIVRDEDKEIISASESAGQNILLKITNPKLWSPNNPFLYDLIIKLERDGEILDEVASYFGMRKIGLGKDKNGILRIELNNKPIFQYGTLDQGYWPDGLYTAPTDEALRYDIEITKKFGFNMIRKHVKVEPARWYYYCDKLGMLVWQDMPNGGKLLLRGKVSKKHYWNELASMISTLYNSPSIVVWVPFNEGWGQFQTKKVVNAIKKYDPSRLVDNASGWFDKKVGDIRDIHNYPGPKMPKLEEKRVAVLGEFGGLGLKIKDHIWGSKMSWSYRQASNTEKLTQRYAKLITKLKPLIKGGLCAAIYTQITDIEAEINGLLTYDREIIKIDEKQLRKLNLSLFK
ncbi:MAG: beta galactosidase jelly roll domain-containing protein [Candidatus Helarchaeota archaeon]|nr:beta galactosidase jelly roll domain-containing protein [Candidatus Helarchaeota archaeon]